MIVMAGNARHICDRHNLTPFRFTVDPFSGLEIGCPLRFKAPDIARWAKARLLSFVQVTGRRLYRLKRLPAYFRTLPPTRT